MAKGALPWASMVKGLSWCWSPTGKVNTLLLLAAAKPVTFDASFSPVKIPVSKTVIYTLWSLTGLFTSPSKKKTSFLTFKGMVKNTSLVVFNSVFQRFVLLDPPTTTELYTLSLHDALPILRREQLSRPLL